MPIKIAGKEITTKANEDFLVLPRGDDEPIVIKAKAVSDLEEFNKLCPEPKPPGKLTKDGFVPNTNDDTYKHRMEQYALQRVGYLVFKSLVPTEIEWITVDPNNPKTWSKWDEDLKNSSFTAIECNHIIALVLSVNNLDEAKLKAARDSFVRGQAEALKDTASLQIEQPSS